MLINKEKLLKEVDDYYDLNYGEVLINPTRFYDMVDEQPTVEQPQWIPCSERLPLEEGEYIVSCINDNGYKFVSDDYFYPSDNAEKGFFEAFGRSVVAWQLFPQTHEEIKEESK